MQEEKIGKFRKLTYEEFMAITNKYHECTKISKVKEIIKQCYPSTAYKVFIRANSEYDDQGYSVENMVLLVLDKGLNELEPIKGSYPDSTIQEILYPTNDNGYVTDDYDDVEDYTFVLSSETEFPELYVEI